jgi:hypothetical protein
LAQREYFKNKVFKISSPIEFQKVALELFHYQFQYNSVYHDYVLHLGVDPSHVNQIEEIPFLPIGFFKTHPVQTRNFVAAQSFTSSGTTGNTPSVHLVKEPQHYIDAFTASLGCFYPKWDEMCILALLPSYLEREGSSLVLMADYLIKHSKDADSGFYLDDLEKLSELLMQKSLQGKKVLLLGVTFALLDLAAQFPKSLNSIIIMETGGMKGRRKEMIRTEVHTVLKRAFKVDKIHSEYGMTELMSQAYAIEEGKFNCPPWMQVIIRETTDPFTSASIGKTGGVNIIDLANIDSCAFIETQDLGRKHKDDSFEIMGRFDNSDIRGCNLMVF